MINNPEKKQRKINRKPYRMEAGPTFLDQREMFKRSIRKWLETEKPWLQPGFKLTDVTQHLPINRTYISRIFNEDFGMSFSEAIRRYRVNEAGRLLKERLDLQVNQIAEAAGFRSASSFNRSFVAYFHVTPRQYRLRYLGKRKK